MAGKHITLLSNSTSVETAINSHSTGMLLVYISAYSCTLAIFY
jgi:hypothetical protein